MEARARGRETTLSRGPQDADAGQLWSGSTEEALTVSWALGHMLGTQPHRTIPAPLRGQFYRPCFTEEETEARGVYRDSPGVHSANRVVETTRSRLAPAPGFPFLSQAGVLLTQTASAESWSLGKCNPRESHKCGGRSSGSLPQGPARSAQTQGVLSTPCLFMTPTCHPHPPRISEGLGTLGSHILGAGRLWPH